MFWMKLAPLFVGIFLVGVSAAAHSGEATKDTHPSKFDRNPIPGPEGCLVPVPDWEEDEVDSPGSGVRMNVIPNGISPDPVSPSTGEESSAKVVCYKVHTRSGIHLFFDLETAKAFARPGELIISDDGTYYQDGKPLLLGYAKTRSSRNVILNAEIDLTNCVGVSPNLQVARGTPSNPGNTKSLKDFWGRFRGWMPPAPPRS